MSGNGEPPAGWWQGPDGRWFPPQVHPDPAWRTLFAAGPTLAVSGRAGQEPTFPLESTFPLEPARPFEPGFPLEPGFPGEGPTDAPAAGPVRLWGLSRRVAGLPAWGWLVSGLTGALLAVAVLLPGDPPAVSDPSVALASGGPGARGVVAAGLSDATPVAPD